MNSNRRYNIHPISKLANFIEDYPNKNLQQKLMLLQQSFPTHRAVKGDGNCFYRAFAFLYLSKNPCFNFEETFPNTTWSYVKKDSRVNSNFQFQNQLRQIWVRHIQPLGQINNIQQKQKKLQNLFNDVEYFDEIIVGYFRSVNYNHMMNQKPKLLAFSKSSVQFENQLQRSRTFGAQSQGIQISSMSQALNTKITVFYIDQKTFQPIEYPENLPDAGIYLFYRPGHYDIVYPYPNYEQTTRVNQNTTTNFNRYQNYNNNYAFNNSRIQESKSRTSSDLGFFKSHKTPQPQQKQPKAKTTPSKTQQQIPISKQQSKESNISKQPQNLKRTKTFFTSKPQVSKYDGKFDLQYRSKKEQSSNSTVRDKNEVSKPVSRIQNKSHIVKSWSDPLSKLHVQAMGVSVLAAFVYLAYSYM